MNVKSRIGQLVGESINAYNNKLKPIIEEVELREKYQSRIIECMIGEVDDNYIETPEVTESVFKLEYSKEGLVKFPTIKGKTILVDADGNETNTPGEGCKLVSVGEDEDNKLIILSRNKNLCTPFMKGGVSSINGELDFSKSAMNTSVITDYIPIDSDRNHYLHRVDSTTYRDAWWFVAMYDDNKNYIKRTGAKCESLLKSYRENINVQNELLNNNIIPRNTKYIILYIYSNKAHCTATLTSDDILKNYKDVQIEEGSVATTYVEPKSHKAEILLDEPLRSLPNGVCDEIIGNQLIRRVGRVILNESEKYTLQTDFFNQEKTIGFRFFNTSLNLLDGNGRLGNSYSNILPNYDQTFLHTNDVEGFSQGYRSIYFRINRDKLETQDVQGFKKWLSENPIEVLYELEEPIIEELPNSIALQCFDDTTMYIENSIIPTVTYGYNALIPYKEELAKQREEVDNNVLDIETNIIPYLTEIEYNLNRMEGN